MEPRPDARARRALVYTLALSLAATLAACGPQEGDDVAAPEPVPTAQVAEPDAHTVTLPATDPAELALAASRTVFTKAPVLVIAARGDDAAAEALASLATALDAPVLLADGPADRAVRSEAERLGAQVAVVVEEDGLSTADGRRSDAQATAQWAGLRVVQIDPDAAVDAGSNDAAVRDPQLLDDLEAALGDAAPPPGYSPLTEVLALVDPRPGQEAALATLQAAGAVTEVVVGGDPGGDAATIGLLRDAQALTVIGVGPAFAAPETFAWQVAAAERGIVLPDGTQRIRQAVFDATRVQVGDEPGMLAATDDEPPADPADPATAVPTLVVRASQRLWDAGADGTYLRTEPLAGLTELVSAARSTGRYVVLEVEGGAVTLLDQVTALDPLLAQGGVGVLVHPEQRRSGAGRDRGGAVTVDELTAVADHLAGLAVQHALPQTLLAVHSFDTAVEGLGDVTSLAAAHPQVAIRDAGSLEGL